MPRLTAIRQLCGNYSRNWPFGIIPPGAAFECDDETAESLESRGLAERFRPPAVDLKALFPAPENKVAGPTENKTALPIELPMPEAHRPEPHRTYRRRAR